MSEYDNTNRGVAFKPYPEQKFILSGKLQVQHESVDNELPIALIMAESKDGKKRIEVFQKVGVLFDNDKNGNDKAPDYSGPLDGINDNLRIAGWKEMKDGNAYMSFKVSPKMDKSDGSGYPVNNEANQASPDTDDDAIPF